MMTMDCRYDCKVSNKMQNKYLKIVKMICFLENLNLRAAHRDSFFGLTSSHCFKTTEKSAEERMELHKSAEGVFSKRFHLPDDFLQRLFLS